MTGTDVVLVDGGRVIQAWRNCKLSTMTRHPAGGRLLEVPAGQVSPGMLYDAAAGLFHTERESTGSARGDDRGRIVIESHVHHAAAPAPRDITLWPAMAAAVGQQSPQQSPQQAEPAPAVARSAEIVPFVPARRAPASSVAVITPAAADLRDAIEAAVDEIERQLAAVAGRLDAAAWNGLVESVVDLTVGLLRAQSLADIAGLQSEVSAAIARAA